VAKRKRSAAKEDAAFDRRLMILLVGIPVGLVFLIAGGCIAWGVYQQRERDAQALVDRQTEMEKAEKRRLLLREHEKKSAEEAELKLKKAKQSQLDAEEKDRLRREKQKEAEDRRAQEIARLQKEEMEREKIRKAEQDIAGEKRRNEETIKIERATAERTLLSRVTGLAIDARDPPVYARDPKGQEGRFYVFTGSMQVVNEGFVQRRTMRYGFFMSGETVLSWQLLKRNTPPKIATPAPDHPLFPSTRVQANPAKK
jgi:hypothetical protein